MLGRSANGIYWMSRYLERAENAARLLDVGFRMALTRGAQAAREEWRSVLVTIGLDWDYKQRFEDYAGPQVFNFILRGPDNPASVLSMLENARSNARTVRTALTREAWETTNEAWMVLRDMLARPVREGNLGEVIAAIRRQTTQVRGAMEGTMLRNEIFNFARIGTFIERADNTARILDVKYHTLLPSLGDVGGAVDYYQWGSLLRSVGAFESYRKIFRDQITPSRVAELLILRDDVPRSLHSSLNELYDILRSLSDSDRQEPERLAGEVHAQLHYGRTEQIFKLGLHEYLMQFLDKIEALNTEINRQYLTPDYA
jgi:uncharacterized alpha-E superfamily protein